MRRVSLRSSAPEGIEFEWPDGSIKTLTRRVINSKNVNEFDRINVELSQKHETKEINGLEYTIETILHIADGVNREDLEDLDLPILMLIANELREVVDNMSRPKKNDLDTGSTKSESVATPD
jgi:hypothetical protein